ncbi:MAG TPA: cation diffusion facilitator family transporter [Verrucomicrobiae bacterium]|nr:cation diffusion facilitator family transporter [Verrucomicrobiae bacterium]
MSARGRLVLSLLLATGVAALEFWGGFTARSLALVGDAVHVCMDVFALSIALIAAIGAARPADKRRTFGYGRVEVLGAMFNGTLLLAATAAIVVAAIRRFGAPVEPASATMIWVAAVGLVVNGVVGYVLLHQHERDLNVRAALFHVLGDALGALAVLIGGVAIAFTGAAWIDPVLSLFVAAIIVAGVLRVLRDATRILLEGVPSSVDVAALTRGMEGISGVTGLHDLHVWSIGSGSHALSAHVAIDDRRLSEAAVLLREIDRCAQGFGIEHVTIQFECESCPIVVKH